MSNKNRDQKVVTESSTTNESIMVGGFFGNTEMPISIPGALRHKRGYDFVDADLMAALPDTEDVWTEASDVRHMVLHARYYIPTTRYEWYVTSKSLRYDGALTFAGYAAFLEREWGLDLGMWQMPDIEIDIPFNESLRVERDYTWKPMTAAEAGMATWLDGGFSFTNRAGAEPKNVKVTWDRPVGFSFFPEGMPAKPLSKGALKKAAQKARREGRAA